MKRNKLIHARRKRGLSQEVAAGLLGVSRNTWSLWERGKESPYPINIGELCKFFGVDDPTALDLESPMSYSEITPLPTHDLDFVDSYIEALQRLLIKGEAQYVMQAAQSLYSKLLGTYQKRDMRPMETQIRLGMLVGLSREYALPWYQRAQPVMDMYDQIENDIIGKYPMNTVLLHHHAKIQAKKSRQYRVLWQFQACGKACENGLSSLNSIEDYPLTTHFLCELAHIEATQGDESHWMQRLEEARIGILSMPPGHREKALNQIDYMQGEGYKRFAFHIKKQLTMPMRETYAQYAYDQFTRWDGATIELPGFESLVVQVSRAQCLILLDPKKAIESAKQLARVAQQNYPALLDKVHRIMLLSQQRLQTSSDRFFEDLSHAQMVGNIL